jgi:hypothetical protein
MHFYWHFQDSEYDANENLLMELTYAFLAAVLALSVSAYIAGSTTFKAKLDKLEASK